MATPTPTPYRNLKKDIENEDLNAEHLQLGVEDAKARLKAASEQYKAMPGVPQEDIRNKAAQDLIERTNAVEKAKTRARELEIKAKPTKGTKGYLDESGQPIIEFPEMDISAPSRGPASDLSALLQLAGNAVAPSAEAATVASTTGGPSFHPPMVAPAQKAAQAVQNIRASGVGRIGDKAQVDEKNNFRITDTKPYLIDKNDVEAIGGAFRETPEWQRQERGLDDLESLIGLEAQRNAQKTSVDLSPLGAYLDYQNTLSGRPTNLARGLKMDPLQDTSIKDMGEIQRRRGDMAKELINTIKASKVGQIVTQDGQVLGYTGGVNVPRPASSSSGQNLRLREVNALRKYTDASFKEPEHQLSAINSMISRIASENPAYIGALPAKLEQMDTGNQRILLGLIGMETYDQSAPARLSQYLKTLTNGTLTDHTKALLLDRLKRSAEDTKLKMASAEEDVRDFSKSLRSLDNSDVENIVGSKVKTTEKAYPRAMAIEKPPTQFSEGGSKTPSVDDLWEKMRTNK